MTAMYSVLFRSPGGSLEEVAQISKDAVSSAAWMSFYNIFTLANGQMRTKMPVLPFARGAEIQDMEHLLEAFDIFEDDLGSVDE